MTDRVDQLGLELARVAAGEFIFGEEGQMRCLPDFWMGRNLVSSRQYAAFVQATGWRPPAHWHGTRPEESLQEHPVVNIYWADAVAFCQWAGCSLPTEAEWEKAARGVVGFTFPWGSSLPTPTRCNFDMQIGATTPVGAYSPQGDSPYGCADMSGNVWEWTASWFDEECRYRVLRGGGFRYRDLDVRTTCRLSILPDSCYNDVGFRVLRRQLPAPEATTGESGVGESGLAPL